MPRAKSEDREKENSQPRSPQLIASCVYVFIGTSVVGARITAAKRELISSTASYRSANADHDVNKPNILTSVDDGVSCVSRVSRQWRNRWHRSWVAAGAFCRVRHGDAALVASVVF